ncbi:MAG: ABC transporter permease [Gemmatimonadales bacterium]|nr:MAG: ABC transporter permease [Gemmatimonadales bacterium]
MRRYLLGRLLLAVPLLLALATLLFMLVELAPGDPADLLISPGMTNEVREQVRTNLGLDEPAPVRYLRWIAAAATGDLGFSHSRGVSVRVALAQSLPNTLLLTGVSLVLAFALGVGVGIVQAVRQSSWIDSVLNLFVLTFYSLPSFWLGVILILVFSYGAQSVWEWPIHFPASGATSVGYDLMGPGERIVDRVRHLILPVGTLVLVMGAGVARYARSALLEVIREDYVRAARARGLGRARVLFRHALPNALLPLITVFGLYLPVLFSGAVFVETVFAWPGMGRLMVDAVASRDFPLVLGGSLVFAVLVVVGNLVADLLYAWADPRVRYG